MHGVGNKTQISCNTEVSPRLSDLQSRCSAAQEFHGHDWVDAKRSFPISFTGRHKAHNRE